MLFGLVPALHASKVDLVDAVKQGGARSVVGGRMVRTRGVLVVSEIALAVVLLTGAGLLVKSLVALHNVDLGFQPENVLVMKATGVRSLQRTTICSSAGSCRESRRCLASSPSARRRSRLETCRMPATARISSIGCRSNETARVEPLTLFTIVAPGAFAALGIPLKSGRDFTEGDTGDRPLVAIVNEALVRKSFAGENPIGRTICLQFDRKEGMTIVGVVGDVRQRNPAIDPMPECYMPYRQHSYNNAHAQRRRANGGRSDGARRDGAARGGGDLAGRAGFVHDDGRDGVEERGGPEIPRAVVWGVCRRWPCVSPWRACMA